MEIEAEAAAYFIGRCFGLDPSESAFYFAVWRGDDSEVIQDRLGRISLTTPETIVSLNE